MNNVILRVTTGIVFLFVVFYTLYATKLSFALLLGGILLVCLWEYFKLLSDKSVSELIVRRRRAIGIFIGLLPWLLSSWQLFKPISHSVLVATVAVAVALFFIFELFAQSQQPFYGLAFTVLGVFYLSLPIAMLFHLRAQLGVQVVGGLMILVIVNDSLAYFWGKMIGETPFFPRLSPQKTMEGFFGGTALTLATSIILSRYYLILQPLDWFAIAVIVAVFGVLGDLVESMLKRSLDIKDTSNLLPGHGGFLDRFDALVFATPFVFFYLVLRYQL